MSKLNRFKKFSKIGFAAKELATRIDHAVSKVIIAASCGLEPTKVIK